MRKGRQKQKQKTKTSQNPTIYALNFLKQTDKAFYIFQWFKYLPHTPLVIKLI